MPVQAFCEWLSTVTRFSFHVVLGCIKAVLPCGVLPRKNVRDQVVLITGSGMGLGRLLAIEFGKLGARLVLWDINEIMNLETKGILEQMDVKVFAYTVDLSDRSQIYNTAEQVKKEVGDVDILINNAGIVSGKKLFSCPDALMEKTMSVNCNALFYTAKSFLPAMMENDSGHIVTISSMAGHVGVNGLVDYCASKHAAVGFTEALRCELTVLKKNITVTNITLVVCLAIPISIRWQQERQQLLFSKRLSILHQHWHVSWNQKSLATIFPILEPDYVADRIMEAVLTNAENLYMPKMSHVFLAIKGLLPSKAVLIIAEYFGLNKTMNEFVGRCN